MDEVLPLIDSFYKSTDKREKIDLTKDYAPLVNALLKH